MTTNRTHRVRLARAFAAVGDVGYQTALSRVISAAEAGLLPDRLDEAGMRQALDILLAQLGAGRTVGLGAAGLEPRYYRLSEVVGEPLPPVAAEWVARACAAGVAAAEDRGSYDHVAMLGLDDSDDESEVESGWWWRVVSAGSRGDFALPCPYPDSGDRDGYLPIDLVLDDRDATGDVDAYERALHAIVESEPRDVDAFVHLGNLYLAMADGRSSELVVTPSLRTRQRQALVRNSLELYLSGVAVAELGLPDPFTGVLVWSELDNRPFLRALHGLALALWQLRRFDAAEAVLLNMLWLNPMDNQGARFVLPEVRAGLRREDVEEP
jgi:hypothetical protein